VRLEFAYDGGGLAMAGNVTLYYPGKEVGKGCVAMALQSVGIVLK
jgi:arylsulfatase